MGHAEATLPVKSSTNLTSSVHIERGVDVVAIHCSTRVVSAHIRLRKGTGGSIETQSDRELGKDLLSINNAVWKVRVVLERQGGRASVLLVKGSHSHLRASGKPSLSTIKLPLISNDNDVKSRRLKHRTREKAIMYPWIRVCRAKATSL
jgi:hypothetical protein